MEGPEQQPPSRGESEGLPEEVALKQTPKKRRNWPSEQLVRVTQVEETSTCKGLLYKRKREKQRH